MPKLFKGLLLLFTLALACTTQAAVDVRVGAYHFPPYVVKPEGDHVGGLLPELLQALNQLQSDYRFTLVATSTMRRYRDLQSGRFDLILFESPGWGWQGIAHTALDLHIEDAEVYVARLQPGRDEHYFDGLSGKRMALYSGYHYGFADFNSDKQVLTQQYNAVLTYSHDSNLIMLLRGRADVAVVTRSYLRAYQQRYPEQSSALLVSQRVDQVYQHQALLRPQSAISPQAFADLLKQLNRDKQLEQLLGRYHLREVSVP
ncbi:transporter substrate-binding domain-containing protein [Pseudomonas sp. 32.2.56]|uniref:substrate-binding periplasmic protein n=1 Tax=Pseudomonas sp. 32.2.56 TaxID=2969303 RepID=UPI0021504611|nr:transporter substrate-binding domain-containing protein [Pseudomonas sp. 32.2.56]MCR4509933.1 transporter substrate-binding domain-containing protein [Pseudomonas sp. 32.2.56]